ncbi:MAG: hypothetical protein HKN85_13210 [Gammaproteobacteria bacterium]|nr:hypothetical protein [Gammaproteobacteria bacterium]
MPSSVVAGDRGLQPQIDQVKQQVISTPRNPRQFIRDAAKMWARISTHRVKEFSSEVMFSKLRPGGLMQSEYLAACLILQQPGQINLTTFDDLLTARVAEDDNLRPLPEILQFWRIQQLWERLLGFSGQSLEGLPEDYLARLLQQSNVDSLDQLLAKKQAYSEKVVAIMHDLFSELDAGGFEADDWREQKVEWAFPENHN